jgi:hypothetical protein
LPEQLGKVRGEIKGGQGGLPEQLGISQEQFWTFVDGAHRKMTYVSVLVRNRGKRAFFSHLAVA